MLIKKKKKLTPENVPEILASTKWIKANLSQKNAIVNVIMFMRNVFPIILILSG